MTNCDTHFDMSKIQIHGITLGQEIEYYVHIPGAPIMYRFPRISMSWTCREHPERIHVYIENEQNFNTTPLWDIYYSSLLTKLWTFSQVYIKGLKNAMVWKYEIHVYTFTLIPQSY